MPKFTKITAKHPKGQFFIGHREILDRKIDGKPIPLNVLGVYLRIMTLAPTWNMNLKGLATICGCSINTVMEAVKKLKELGYIEQKQSREQGRITGSDYIFKETVNSNLWNVAENRVITDTEDEVNSENINFCNEENIDTSEVDMDETLTNIESDPHLKKSYMKKSYMKKSYMKNCDAYIVLNNIESINKESNDISLSKGQICNLPEGDVSGENFSFIINNNIDNNDNNNFSIDENNNSLSKKDKDKEKEKTSFPNNIPRPKQSTTVTQSNSTNSVIITTHSFNNSEETNYSSNSKSKRDKHNNSSGSNTKDKKGRKNHAQILDEQEKQSVKEILAKGTNAKKLSEQTEKEKEEANLTKEKNLVKALEEELRQKQNRKSRKENTRVNIIQSIQTDYASKSEVSELFISFINSSFELGKPITVSQYNALKSVLFELSNGDANIEKEIIRNSLINGWKNFYALHDKEGYIKEKGKNKNKSKDKDKEKKSKTTPFTSTISTDIKNTSTNPFANSGGSHISTEEYEEDYDDYDEYDTSQQQTGVIRNEKGEVIGFR